MNENNSETTPSPEGEHNAAPRMDSRDREFALKYHETMMRALGSRERQVILMLAYVVPALVALAWMISYGSAFLLFCGSIILSVMLAHGRQHIIRMAYNYRSCLLQVKKIEEETGWKRYVLKEWANKTYTSPTGLLPEIFKAQIRILQFVMWAIIGTAAMAIPDSMRRGPESVILLIGLVILGVIMERLCVATLRKARRDLRWMYRLERRNDNDESSPKAVSNEEQSD